MTSQKKCDCLDNVGICVCRPEEEHGLQASAAKQRIDAQAGAVPPAVGEYAVQERAAFEAWYLGHFYMGDKQCGLEWLSTESCGGYRHQHPAEQWVVWQARAALSAPSHGGGVAHTDCRSEDGITVGLIDSIITSCRVLSSRDLTCEAAVEALRDLRSDSDVSLIKPNHSEQVREVVPAGWKLVPVEPAPEMLAAGDKYIGTPATYKAMLSACPSPPLPRIFLSF